MNKIKSIIATATAVVTAFNAMLSANDSEELEIYETIYNNMLSLC